MNNRNRYRGELAVRLLIAAVFVYAGAVKALDPASFALAVDNYRVLPHPGPVVVALYLPWLEIVCGLALFWPELRLGAAVVLTVMSAIFAAATGSALIRGLDIGCGCFSTTGESVVLEIAMMRSIALVVACAWLWRRGTAARHTTS